MRILYFLLEPPYRYFAIDDEVSEISGQGSFDDLSYIATLAKQYDEIIGIVPGELVSVLEVEIPIRSRKKALQAVPFVLEDKVAGNIEDVHFFLLDWKPQENSTVAIIQRDKWYSYIHWIEESGIEIKAIVPDYSLLPLTNDESATLFLEAESNRILLKYFQGDLVKGMVISRDELPFWLDEFNHQGKKIVCNDSYLLSELMSSGIKDVDVVQQISKNNIDEICLELSGTKRFSSLQLYNSDVVRKVIEKSKPWLVLSMFCLLLALIVNVGFDLYEYRVLKSEEAHFDQKIEQIFKDSFPSVNRIVDPQLQFQRELDALEGNAKGSQEFLYLVGNVIASLPKNVTIIDELHYKNSALDVIFKVTNFQVLDRFSSKLKQNNAIKFERLSSDSQGGKVFAKYRFSVIGE